MSLSATWFNWWCTDNILYLICIIYSQGGEVRDRDQQGGRGSRNDQLQWTGKAGLVTGVGGNREDHAYTASETSGLSSFLGYICNLGTFSKY